MGWDDEADDIKHPQSGGAGVSEEAGSICPGGCQEYAGCDCSPGGKPDDFTAGGEGGCGFGVCTLSGQWHPFAEG